MRTRRSPRNQEILWRALGKQMAPAEPAKPTLPVVNRCWDCESYPNHGRARGECVRGGMMVNGRTENRECFRPRGGGSHVA